MPLFRFRKKSDSDLAKLIILNNEKAFEEFIKRYQAQLFSFCLSFIKDKTEAEDMVQETFLKFYTAIESINPDKNLKSYIFKIARNLCLDNLKKKKPIYKKSPPEMESLTNPYLEYCKSQEEKMLYLAMEELNENEKTSILLKYRSGLKYSEISEVLNRSESAVESILFRAKKKLRKKMQEMKV